MADQIFFSLADLGLPTNTTAYLQDWLTQMQATYPDYTPSAANLEYVLAQIFASWAADCASLASFGATNLFQTFGTQLINLPPLQGQSAWATINISTAAYTGGAIGVLSSPLSTGSPITSLPVNPTVYDIPAGTLTLTSGVNTQTWTTTGIGAPATAIPVASQTPNFAYPAGSSLTGTIDYTLPSGTQFALDGYGFATLQSYDIAAGSSAPIVVYAVETGADYNGAGSNGVVQLISQIDWVTGVTLASGAASGGADAETPNAYLNRLAQTLQTMAQRPITANDYAIMAQNFVPLPGTDQQEVGRAAAIDGATLASPVTRTVYLYVTDANGNPLNTDTMNAISSWFTSLREANFVVNVSPPSYQPVYVSVTVHLTPGFDQATVEADIQSAIITWLSPANFGTSPPYGIAGTWATSQVTIYRSQLEGVIQNVNGVDHVVTGTLAMGLTTGPTNTTSDLTLPGTATLPVANTSTVPLSAINFA